MKFVIRLFPEITIKSAPVRKRLTKVLVEGLRVLLKRVHPSAKVIRDWDKLDVEVDACDEAVAAQIIDCLACTPGIAHFFRVKAYEFETVEDICARAITAWAPLVEGLCYCVRVNRTGKHSFTSTDVERLVGSAIGQHSQAVGVNLKNPDICLNLEIKDQTVYIIEQRYSGLGGFPVGTQEGVLSLISGGFDSTVASFLTIKRGLKTHYCFFSLGGREHEAAVKEVAFYLWNRFASTHRVKFITVPFEGVVNEILEKISPANMGVVLKRLMLRAAERVAAKGGIQALVTGEAVAQVSSQTLPNLAAIDAVSKMLVLRPLVTVDKRDIIAISRTIGAENFSAQIPEYCGVISVKPSAKINLQKLEKEEQELDTDVFEVALKSAYVQNIDEVMADPSTPPDLQVYSEPEADATVIDIRHEIEKENRPLALAVGKYLEIPFYALSSEMEKLDRNQKYLLYCDKGVMSKLHAAHLLSVGYGNVGVYRPGIDRGDTLENGQT